MRFHPLDLACTFGWPLACGCPPAWPPTLSACLGPDFAVLLWCRCDTRCGGGAACAPPAAAACGARACNTATGATEQR
ncbi:MAG: hypothetical protein J3K34DRAFT_428537 [Monoraphidium minutum]|nr:MAG: hypothetical protein J3K34DRAFT_428537 [Monoraphidium minutum]